MRKQYSITGSVVIIASRIENLTKRFKTVMLASEEVISKLTDNTQEEFNSLGSVKVKGREEMVSLYKFKELNE